MSKSGKAEEQLLFTESMIMDYVTLKGIENRFSIKKEEIPVSIFKELQTMHWTMSKHLLSIIVVVSLSQKLMLKSLRILIELT